MPKMVYKHSVSESSSQNVSRNDSIDVNFVDSDNENK